jgi:putative transposase
VPGAAHFVTYRLFGSLPQAVLLELREKKESLLARRPTNKAVGEFREQVHKQIFARYDEYLDVCGADCLRDSRIAEMILSNLHYHNGTKYYLIAYCVMPNHVHFLFQPIDVATGGSPVAKPAGELIAASELGETADAQSPLAQVMHSLKSYTAHEANRILDRTGAFWQAESYDHWVRDESELERIVSYIDSNPVKAGLVDRPEQWVWSSAHDRLSSTTTQAAGASMLG